MYQSCILCDALEGRSTGLLHVSWGDWLSQRGRSGAAEVRARDRVIDAMEVGGEQPTLSSRRR